MQMFRNSALEHQQAPDDLDHALRVSDRRSWMFLLALTLLLVAGILWSIFGEVTRRLEAPALLLNGNGSIYNAVAFTGGQVTELSASEDDMVDQGDVIAQVQTPQLEQEVQQAGLALNALQAQRSELQREVAAQTGALNDRADYLKKAISSREDERSKGFATNDQVESLRVQFASTLQQIQATRLGLVELDGRITEAQFRLTQAKSNLDRGRLVRAPITGRIVESSVKAGEIVGTGDRVALIETSGSGFEAIIFVKPDDGKRVYEGMAIQLSPAGFLREEFGYIPGEIVTVGDFPATQEALINLVGNEAMAALVSENGPPFIARAKLELADDGGTLAWSGRAPARGVTSGAVGTANVVLETVRPITLVIPTLKKWMGL